MSIDVNLPRTHAACFPDRCVVCGANHPGSDIRITTNRIGWLSLVSWWFPGRFTVHAPACAGCGWKLQGVRAFQFLITLALILVAIFLIWPYFQDAVPKRWERWAMLGLGVVCILPLVIVEIFFVAPFDVTAFENSVDYEFASKEYAITFAVLNRDAEWVKIEGAPIDFGNRPSD